MVLRIHRVGSVLKNCNCSKCKEMCDGTIRIRGRTLCGKCCEKWERIFTEYNRAGFTKVNLEEHLIGSLFGMFMKDRT